MEVCVETLRDKYPDQFRKEYQEWAENDLGHEWWDFIEEDFINDCKEKGVSVDHIEFSLGYCQSDYVSFVGHVRLADFMQLAKLDEEYPALYRAIKADGSYVDITTSHRGNMRYNMCENTQDIDPHGVFDGLDYTVFQEIVENELAAADLEGTVAAFCEDLTYDLRVTLYEEVEHLTSEDSFIEHCHANDVLFDVEDEDC